MAKRRTIVVLVLCSSIALLAVQALPRTADARRRRNISPQERKRGASKRRRQQELENERRRRELGSEQLRLDRDKKLKELEKQKEEAGGFIFEKFALGATEEQWKLIKPKLEKVRHLRNLERSTVGVGLISSSGSRSVPTWKWRKRWKDKPHAELTEAQKIANTLMDLVDSKNTKPEEFKKKMDALRESRRRQEKLKKQLSEAREELRAVLTTRQEAALVLKGWL